MPVSLLDGIDLAIVVVVVTVGALLRRWISLREAHLHEKSMTERFTRALDGSSPQQRPEIIRAMGWQSGRPGDETPSDDAEAETREEWSFFAWLARLWRKPPWTRG